MKKLSVRKVLLSLAGGGVLLQTANCSAFGNIAAELAGQIPITLFTDSLFFLFDNALVRYTG